MFEYTDPEGNVISESEVQKLADTAKTKLSYYTTEKKLKRRAVKAKETKNPFPKTEGLDPLGIDKMTKGKPVKAREEKNFFPKTEEPDPLGVKKWLTQKLKILNQSRKLSLMLKNLQEIEQLPVLRGFTSKEKLILRIAVLK